ncbi:MAG: NUDIX hydrolase [Rhodospirillaceae bacterium]|jgi:8-oxo-dGTP diphosphatase|nr:NUDIX hydrolase [Rhodospirillaceae bacterium]MBT6119005.1 NUDIX hydrolase [Rhodospirillaceae bacterium]
MKRDYPDRPFVGVGVVVLRGVPRGDEVLLVRRAKPPSQGHWSIPGGAQHVGETLAEAALREVREETGLDVELVEQIAVIDSIRRDDAGAVAFHYTLIDFVALWRGGEPVAGDDASEAIWAPIARIADYGMWDETERIIRLARDRVAGIEGDE